MCPEFFCVHEDDNSFYCIPQNFLPNILACAGKFLAFIYISKIVDIQSSRVKSASWRVNILEWNVWKFIISFIYQMTTKIFKLINISGVCLEISSMCPKIQILLFCILWHKIIRLLKVSSGCPEIYGMCLKISRLVHISGVCSEISSMCPETLIAQKYKYLFNIIYKKKSRLLKFSRVCPEVLSMW